LISSPGENSCVHKVGSLRDVRLLGLSGTCHESTPYVDVQVVGISC